MNFEAIHKKILKGLIVATTILVLVIFIIFSKKFGEKTYLILMSINFNVLLLVALLSVFTTVVLLPLRTYGILRASGFDLTLKDVVLIYLASIPIANLTPGQRVLASAFVSYLLWLYTKKSGEECSVYYVLDMFTTFIITIIFVVVITWGLGIPKVLRPIWNDLYKLILLGLFLCALAFIIMEIYVMRREFKNEKIIKAKRIYKMFKKALKNTITDPKNFIFIYAVTILLYFAGYVEISLMMSALGVSLGIQEISVAECLISIIRMIPTTPGDIGLLEGAQAFVYSTLGVPKDKIIVYYILNRTLLFLLPTLIGTVAFYILYFTKLKHLGVEENGKKS